MYSVLYIFVWGSLIGYGLGKPFASTQSQIANAHIRSKRQTPGTPSLVDFEIRKASLESIAQILKVKYCNDDHLAGVICPGEEEAEEPTCVSWREICDGNQICGVEEFDQCLEQTVENFGIPWFDFCRGDEKVDFCRLRDFEPMRCGEDIVLKKGAKRIKILSANYDSDYPNNAFCFWRLSAPEGESIKINIRDFFTEKNYDFVNIGNGHDYLSMDADNLLVNKHSGDELPEPAVFRTPTNEVFIAFYTDAYDNERGFKIDVSVAKSDDDTEILVPKVPEINTDCGNSSVIDLGEGGEVIITSPNFPEVYNPNMQCDWRLKVPSGRRVGISVIRLDTEYQSDPIVIGSGKNIGDDNSIVTRLEGNEVPKKPFIVDDSDVWIRFTSDAAIERTGFKFKVSEAPATGCGGDFKVPVDGSVLIASPNYPHLAYRLNQNCEWRFKAAPGRKLTVQFLDFKTKVADSVSAGFDESPAFDWSNYVIVEHTGDELPDPPAFDSRKGAAWISFTSDSFEVERGFKALVGDTSVYASGYKARAGEKRELNQDCGFEVDREEELSEIVITSPGLGSFYPPLLDCLWVINLPFGGHVKIFWHQFSTEAMRDVFTLGNGSDPTLASSVVLDKFSGFRAPKQIDDYFQSLWIRFQTDLHNSFRGFQITIIPVPYTACGGLLEVPEGGSLTIASPGYPNYYPNSQICRYTIQSTSGTRILFTITKFETSLDDYLSVGEGCDPGEGGGIILDKQTFSKPDNYQFMPRTAAVWMKFFSSRYRNAKGWMINLADSGVPVDEERGFGSCEPYTSDPTTDPPPKPTKKMMEEEGSGLPGIPDYQSPIDAPDWYNDLSEMVVVDEGSPVYVFESPSEPEDTVEGSG